jgi:hypothetical protein
MTLTLWVSHMLIFHRWRCLRRVAVEGFTKSAVHLFHPIQAREAFLLALALIRSPSDPEKHLQRHASSIMFSVNYGFPPVESEDDPAIVAITNLVARLSHEMQPGTRLVESFTWMRYIPSRCLHRGCLRGPLLIVSSRFAKWKRNAEYWFVQDSLMFEGLLGKVADDLVSSRSGTLMRCVIVCHTRRMESIFQVSVPQ